MLINTNKIEITSVSVERSNDGKYQVTVAWMLDESESASYTGDYDICLIDITGEIETQKAAGSYATVTFERLTNDGDYFVKVRASQEAAELESKSERIITDIYENFSGIYDGTTLTLTWDADKFSSPTGSCTLTADNEFQCVYTIYPGQEKAVIEGVSFKPGRTFTAQVCSMSGCSQGPLSEELKFYTSPPVMTEALAQENNDTTLLAAKFLSENLGIDKIWLLFKMDGEVVREVKYFRESKNDAPTGLYNITMLIDSSVLAYDVMVRCTLTCGFGEPNARTYLSGDSSEIPLVSPSVSACDVQNGKVVMRITYPESIAAYGFELPDGSVISEKTYLIDAGTTGGPVYPRFDRNGTVRRGNPSPTVSGFVPGYYVHSDGLAYWSAGYKEANVSHTWKEELFKTPPGDLIKSGALSLAHVDNEYTLTVKASEEGQSLNLDIEDYKGFIGKIKDSITPYGFFALTDVILRIAQQSFGDTPYLLCAYSPRERFSDIRPGLRLTADTALYMQQPNSKLENVEGFVSANNAGWSFVLNSDGSFLEPDLFMGRIAKYMSNGSLNDATKVAYATGAADFMRPAMHQPYYRVLFPASLELSMAAEDLFPSDNTVIMTSDSYGTIQDACQKIASNPASINQLDIPLMIFRGRSALSLSIPIQINGNICHVPVGCNVSQALSMYGYGCSTSIKMMRENDNRIPRPVFLEKDAQLDKLVLIPGDRLEVQYENQSD